MNAIHALPNLISYSKGDEPTSKPTDDSDADSDDGVTDMTDDEHFNDPAADLKFLSFDRVVFRLSSWHMKKKSGFIRDMMDVTGAKHGIDDYIALSLDSLVLRYFFPAFYGNVSHAINLDWHCCQYLLKLADQFQAPEVEKSLLLGMQHHGWDVFEIAAEKNHVDVGRACIKHFDKHPTPADNLPYTLYETHKADMHKLPTSWALELVKCRLLDKYETDKSGGQTRTWRKRKWSEGADSFSP